MQPYSENVCERIIEAFSNPFVNTTTKYITIIRLSRKCNLHQMMGIFPAQNNLSSAIGQSGKGNWKS